MRYIVLNILFFCIVSVGFANPYWNESKVPKDFLVTPAGQTIHLRKNFADFKFATENIDQTLNRKEALRITARWDSKTEGYSIQRAVVEMSGTDSLVLRSKISPKWGSYVGKIYYGKSKSPTYFDSIGTGKEYRKLVSDISFRFPVPESDFRFELTAENPSTGEMQVVLSKEIKLNELETESYQLETMEYRVLRKAHLSPALMVGIYADGYLEGAQEVFWADAQRAVQALLTSQFPGVAHMEFVAVFAPSNIQLGRAQDLGLPVKARDSFLGLYYPYWNNFGRWYHIVYPTNEEKFRQNLALIPYDHNIVLVDSEDYWGVGNYKTHTAIPSRAAAFTYLLLHEIGHYFGLNEEYEGGGRTELEFAPHIKEVWSQNITLLPEKNLNMLKWAELVSDPLTPIPTPKSFWKKDAYGAYLGGYADSLSSQGKSHKPGFACVMDRYSNFCKICAKGIQDTINRDLGFN